MGFVVTGSLSTLVMFCIYTILCHFISYHYAYLIAYSTSVIMLYFMNLYVFKGLVTWHTMVKFPLIYLLQYVLGALSLAFVVRLGFPVSLAPILIVIALLPFTYLLNRLVFRVK